MKPILIIPLMGKRRKNLFFDKKFLFHNKTDYLLNHIYGNFNFCQKIIIVCKKTDRIFFKFNNLPKLSFIYLKSSTNQINSITKVEKKIDKNRPIFILNPDSYFNFIDTSFSLLKKLKKGNMFLFGIKNYKTNLDNSNKDTFITNKSKIVSINIKKGETSKNNCFVSAGLYYFKSFKIFNQLCYKFKKENNIKSSSFQLAHIFRYALIKLYKVNYALVQNFVDFGDDNKLKEYFFWSSFFNKNFYKFDNIKNKDILNIIPSAGEGSRHKKLGYNKPKPLIPISNNTMFESSIERLPNRKENLFIFKKKTFKKFKIKKIFKKNKNLKNYFLINKRTKGMAETIYLAKEMIPDNKPVIVSSCDISFIINYRKFYNLLKKDPDGIIFTWRDYPFADESPNSHAYVKTKKNIIKKISEKKVISNNPNKDFAVTGIFYFKSSNLLLDCIKYMIENNITINKEYYVATSMNKLLKEKLKVYNFEVDQFISWSLPEHLQKYNFWESVFK